MGVTEAFAVPRVVSLSEPPARSRPLCRDRLPLAMPLRRRQRRKGIPHCPADPPCLPAPHLPIMKEWSDCCT